MLCHCHPSHSLLFFCHYSLLFMVIIIYLYIIIYDYYYYHCSRSFYASSCSSCSKYSSSCLPLPFGMAVRLLLTEMCLAGGVLGGGAERGVGGFE